MQVTVAENTSWDLKMPDLLFFSGITFCFFSETCFPCQEEIRKTWISSFSRVFVASFQLCLVTHWVSGFLERFSYPFFFGKGWSPSSLVFLCRARDSKLSPFNGSVGKVGSERPRGDVFLCAPRLDNVYCYSRWWFNVFFHFNPILEKIPILTNIWVSWNHQLGWF